MADGGPVDLPVRSAEEVIVESLKRTYDVFAANNANQDIEMFFPAQRMRLASKLKGEYDGARKAPSKEAEAVVAGARAASAAGADAHGKPSEDGLLAGDVGGASGAGGSGAGISKALQSVTGDDGKRDETAIVAFKKTEKMAAAAQGQSRAIVARRAAAEAPKPKWHAPWKLMRVISGHGGWVRSVAVEPGNQWFVTGSADRTIKVWDLASGTLRLTLTGHINAIRGLCISPRSPYMFSASEDKKVLCWDLESNKVIRYYHGHLSGVYSLALHPTIDVLISGGRDAVAHVWDIRTKKSVHTLAGHTGAVNSILTNPTDPQIITSSLDKTIRTWDLVAGKPMTVLTHHKKGVRALASHSKEFTFLSGAADSIKKWKLPDSQLLKSFRGHDSIINSLSLNSDDVLMSGGDDGTMRFWDYNTGYCFQEEQTKVQPGSLESEAGIFASTFDQTGSRLITCEADKTIKVWKEDTSATPESHPIDMGAWTTEWRKFRRY